MPTGGLRVARERGGDEGFAARRDIGHRIVLSHGLIGSRRPWGPFNGPRTMSG